jgi:hypothetical protein
MVYTAMYGTETPEKVVVKSTAYSEAAALAAESQSVYVNYLQQEDLNVAYYIDPFVEVSDDKSKLVTVSHFLDGFQSPESLYNVASMWWSDEDVVRTLGSTLANFRLASAKFEKEKPEEFTTFPKWDTINMGWQKLFTPITIDTTPENFGIIHGDLHTGNWMIHAKSEQLMDLFEVALLDFDNAQVGWYVIDIGTVLFSLNLSLYPDVGLAMSMDAYNAWFYQFKRWLVDSYETTLGFNIEEDDLQQGCRWRKDFMYTLYSYGLPYLEPGTDDYKYVKSFCDFYESGNMPNC